MTGETNEQTYEQLALLLKATADPFRLQILKVLGEASFGVLELCQIFAVAQPGMSHHLKLLAKAGLLSSQREGNSIFYRRNLANQFLLQQPIFQAVDQIELHDQVAKNLQQVEQERFAAAQEFFSKHATQFKKQQDLIAEFAAYETICAEMLNKACEKSPCEHALEIGPGEGLFLKHLSNKFKQVSALDISKELLAQAKSYAMQHNLSNIEFSFGELKEHQQLQNLDFAVLNMVLHHISAPKDFLRQTAARLKSQGFLMLTDLCQHDQHWAKDSCGDLWLGFDIEQLEYWAAKAKLKLFEQSFTAMRNGFQVQCLLFQKL